MSASSLTVRHVMDYTTQPGIRTAGHAAWLACTLLLIAVIGVLLYFGNAA